MSVRALPHLEALGLLADLHDVLAPQLPLPPLVVLLLVGQLRQVLRADQVGPHLLDGVDLAELQLLHGLVVTQQHGVLQVLLGLPLVQLLDTHTHTERVGECQIGVSSVRNETEKVTRVTAGG